MKQTITYNVGDLVEHVSPWRIGIVCGCYVALDDIAVVVIDYCENNTIPIGRHIGQRVTWNTKNVRKLKNE